MIPGARGLLMDDAVEELRKKGRYYTQQALSATTEVEREMLLSIAAESEKTANELDAMRARRQPRFRP